MKVTMLTGSPHKAGTTCLLADEFFLGAKAAGHDVVLFETAHLDIRPCSACDYCRGSGGECLRKDDMRAIYPHLKETDVLVLVTPLYYYGMTAQLKSAIDRFYAINDFILSKGKKLVLLAACEDDDKAAYDALDASIKALCDYLKLEMLGEVKAYACGTREAIAATDYPAQARKLGASL